MADPKASKDKESFIVAVVALEPGLHGTEDPGIATNTIYHVCKSFHNLAVASAAEIKNSIVNKLVSMGVRRKFVKDAHGTAVLIHALYQSFAGSAAASDSEDGDGSQTDATITISTTTTISSSSSSSSSSLDQSSSKSTPSSPPPPATKQQTAGSSATVSSSSSTQSTALQRSTKQQDTPSSSAPTQRTTPAHAANCQATSPSSSSQPTAALQGAASTSATAQSTALLRPAMQHGVTSSTTTGPLYTSAQLGASPYQLMPAYTPGLNAQLPYELKEPISIYAKANYSVLFKLIEHGGRHHAPAGTSGGVPRVQTLRFRDFHNHVTTMSVRRLEFRDHIGWRVKIPYILSSQYRELYNSLVHHAPANWRTVVREILDELEIAITNRAAVHAWYSLLPANDSRFALNPNHLAFLTMLERLENGISRALATGQLQLIH